MMSQLATRGLIGHVGFERTHTSDRYLFNESLGSGSVSVELPSTAALLPVPIIPEFLYDIKHPNATLSQFLEAENAHGRATLAANHRALSQALNPIRTTSSTSANASSGAAATPKCPCAPNRGNDSHLEFLYATTTLASDLPGKKRGDPRLARERAGSRGFLCRQRTARPATT